MYSFGINTIRKSILIFGGKQYISRKIWNIIFGGKLRMAPQASGMKIAQRKEFSLYRCRKC